MHTVPLIVLLPVLGKALTGWGEQRRRALRGTALLWLLWLFLQPAPQASSQPKSQAMSLFPSWATTMKRRASDSESSVCRTR